jgi:glycosyltransferase involved in cell wall biosynthesis
VPALTAGGPHFYALRPDSTVGGEVYERELLRRLPAHGVTVLTRRRTAHWALAPLVSLPAVLWLARRVDVLRGHSVRHTGPALLLGRALTGRPVVLHHHHLYPRWARLEAAIARRADAVVTVSEHSKRELVALGVPAELVHVVVEGIARPEPTGGWEDAWPGPGLKLLYLGRLEPRKRPDLAVDTLAAVRAAGVEASLVVAGEGGREPLEARAAGQPVRFTGRVSEHDKWRLYDSADVLLFGSTLEGFGLVVAEAQSRGVPVVAAAGTATVEALDAGRSGLLAAPEPEAFAARVRELADDGRRAEMAAHAREFARRFDWDACAAGVASLYRDLVR